MAPYNPFYAPRSSNFRFVLLSSTSLPALGAYGIPHEPATEPEPEDPAA